MFTCEADCFCDLKPSQDLPRRMADDDLPQTIREALSTAFPKKPAISREQDKWTDCPDNLDRWLSAALNAGDRRVLITHWMVGGIGAVHSKESATEGGKTSRLSCKTFQSNASHYKFGDGSEMKVHHALNESTYNSSEDAPLDSWVLLEKRSASFPSFLPYFGTKTASALCSLFLG